MTACLLKNDPASLLYVALLKLDESEGKVKARVNSPYDLFTS